MHELVAFIAGTLLLIAPGASLALACRLPWTIALAAAPPVSLALMVTSAIAADVLSIRWSVFWVIGLAVIAAVAMWVLARHAGDSRIAVHKPGWTAIAASLGISVSLVVVLSSFLRAPARLGSVAQLNDVAFHLNSVRDALETGVASPLAFTFVSPETTSKFYPGGWRAFVTLVAELGSVPVPVATNIANLVIAGVAWPLGIALLTRVVAGARWLAVGASSSLAGATAAMPHLLLNYGPVYPYMLGTALVPSAVGVAVVALSLGGRPVLPRRRAALILPWVLMGVVAAHPSAGLSVVVLLAPYLFLAANRSLGRAAPRMAATYRRILAAVGLATAMVSLWAVIGSTALGSSVASVNQEAARPISEALAGVLLLAPAGTTAQLAVSVSLLLALYGAFRFDTCRIMAVNYLLVGVLYLLAASIRSPVASAVVGLWYTDPRRVGALLTIPALVVIGCGVDRGASAARRFMGERNAAGKADHAVNLAAVAGVAAVVITASWPLAIRYAAYTDSPAIRDRFWSSAEESFSPILASAVPVGTLVANNPLDGSSLHYAFAGAPMLFPYQTGTWDADRLLIGSSLREAAQRDDVCAALERLGVPYAVEGTGGFLSGHWEEDAFAGISSLDTAAGFTPVLSNSEVTVYRIDAC